ncbi:hypothetical protein FDJ20_gp160 [Vibrio phage Thalassa]|uniref:Uncharacterized protein n=2 Tax=Thalassavirus TaxID=2948922 RepID=A0A2H5BH70_9CAUD|nr:hypothetical protein FDJ20_gp160 [Vibrio phage Thalassa]AUG85342.1 hypothetical protein THALASSA_163 [Vibrio phage Thalassa]
MKMYLSGFAVLSFCVSSFFAGAYVQRLRLEAEKPAFPLRAIQATCTKTNDCTIFLYQNKPEIQSVASGKDQTPRKAKTVIVRN